MMQARAYHDPKGLINEHKALTRPAGATLSPVDAARLQALGRGKAVRRGR